MANVIIPPEHQSALSTPTLTSAIVAPDGSVLNKPVVQLDARDAALLREYKKFLERHHLREALYCNDCFTGNLHDGTRAHVTASTILIECRCKDRVFNGYTV